MNLSEYTAYDALGLAELVRRRDVTPHDLAALALAACERVNPRLNAVIALLPDWEAQFAGQGTGGPFHGVPFLIKDLVLHAQGVACDMGSRLVKGRFVAPEDSELMRRFRAAGVLTLGRTNTPEFGFAPIAEPVLYGPTRNPWDPSRTSGGSSGGSAAAVAAGIVPIAHANDGGGSIRIPASCCGLVGLKPTRGRTPVGPDAGDPLHGMGIEHVVTRTVRDCAAMLDAIEGPQPGDYFAIARPARPYLQEAATPPRRLRIAFSTAGPRGAAVDAQCAQAVHVAARLCESLGHAVEEAHLQFDEEAFHAANLVYWCSFLAGVIDACGAMFGCKPSPDVLETSTWAAYRHGHTLSALDLERADAVKNAVCRSVAPFFTRHDVLLTPTLLRLPAAVGEIDANAPDASARGWYDQILLGFAPFTALFNMTGQPAISLPLASSAEGVPIGVQFVAPYGDEATLLQLAGQLEIERPWRGRKPSVHAAATREESARA
ncbi:MAG: 6-aminohexanoate-cyclic-dimer hydrolase [Burkholderiaceae bacterium]|nr:6-aminohexanoate-cyclic-dimer hydrolase [Burkholderiaceae bacterium]